jgi:hypothetical protein
MKIRQEIKIFLNFSAYFKRASEVHGIFAISHKRYSKAPKQLRMLSAKPSERKSKLSPC